MASAELLPGMMATILNTKTICLSFECVDNRDRPTFKPVGESDLRGSVRIEKTFVQRHLRDVDLRRARVTLVRGAGPMKLPPGISGSESTREDAPRATISRRRDSAAPPLGGPRQGAAGRPWVG